MVIGLAAPASARVFSLEAHGAKFCEPPQGNGRSSAGLDVTDPKVEPSSSHRTAGMSVPPKGSHSLAATSTFWGNREAVATLEVGQEDLHEGQADSAHKRNKEKAPNAEPAQEVAAWQDEVYLAHLPPDEQVEVLRMLEPDPRMWDGHLGTMAGTTHRIEVLPGSKPVHAHPYRAGSHARVAEKTEIDRMLAQQVIEPATCEWASPIVLVPKPDGTLRFCVNYRRLNMITFPDTYPLPRMDECIDSLGESVMFTTLDCNSGYWKIPVHPGDRDKNTFTSRYGTYRFLRPLFGLRSDPATFQRAIDIILSGVKWKTCLVYLDDVIVFSGSR
jgi:hypothetical protein